MDIKMILKNHIQQKYLNVFPMCIQCLIYGHLMLQEISIMYAKVKIVQESFANPKESTK